MGEPLFLEAVLQEKIWGGKKLADVFGYLLPNDKIGEAWAISAHPNGPSKVLNGPYKGLTLNEVWDNHREVFGDAEGNVFPLLTKILDAEDDLSVQVHPDDAYGLKHEGELGKTECWYIIDADESAEIIYGHHAASKDELKDKIQKGEWNELFRRIKVKKGDFFYVPSGTIHAIGAGILILETQQSSDTTYRVYDYDRRGDDGKPRELHIQQSVDVTTVPHQDPELQIQTEQIGTAEITVYLQTPFFNVYKWNIHDQTDFKAAAPYTLVSVIDGEGSITVPSGNSYPIAKGSHFILPNDVKTWTIDGNLLIIASTPGEKR